MRWFFRFKDGYTLLLSGDIAVEHDSKADRYILRGSGTGRLVGIVNLSELQYHTVSPEEDSGNDDESDS